MGEAPGKEEDEKGIPFVGRAGKLLRNILKDVVKCRPPNNRIPLEEEIKSCFPFLEKQIEILKPRIIVSLGITALKTLRGKNHKIRGKILEVSGNLIFPSFHPSFALRNREFEELF